MSQMSYVEYSRFVDKRCPRSSVFIKLIRAFAVGGFICTIGQIVMNLYIYAGIPKDSASAFTSISMIFLGGFLTAIDVYDDIAKFAGAGTIVPITGFANAVVSPAIEFKIEGMVLGMSAKMFVIAGPVLVYGITASVVCGLFLLL